jgi:ACS family 4-hydroxyphenylacetate permease-like MFS transporter
MDGWSGLAGWQWLFLLEGLPAVVFGIICLFYLDDSPARAKWFSEDEKREIAARLDQDRAFEESEHSKRSVLSQLGSRNVVLLCAAYFGLITSLNANSTWVPQIVHGLTPDASFAVIGLLTALPAILTVAIMPSWGASSDRRNERVWHLRIALLLAAAGWLLVIGSNVAIARYLGLVLVSAGSFCALLTFWTIPVAILSPAARPAGIAFVNTIGIGGGSAISPLVIGYLKDLTGGFTSGLIYVVVMLIMSVICVTIVAAQMRPLTPIPSPSRA